MTTATSPLKHMSVGPDTEPLSELASPQAAVETVDDLDFLLDVLTPTIRGAIVQTGDLYDLIEVILDLGRPPEARYISKTVYLSDQTVGPEELAFTVGRVGTFSHDNRAGIPRTLADRASACAKLPLLWVTTPRWACSSGSSSTALRAPRILNAPIF